MSSFRPRESGLLRQPRAVLTAACAVLLVSLFTGGREQGNSLACSNALLRPRSRGPNREERRAEGLIAPDTPTRGLALPARNRDTFTVPWAEREFSRTARRNSTNKRKSVLSGESLVSAVLLGAVESAQTYCHCCTYCQLCRFSRVR